MIYLLILLQVILLDGILSIDNSAALGAIASKLPKIQQGKALKAGIVGAYIGRGLMLLFAGYIIRFPILRLAGVIYLMYLVGTHFFNWPQLFNFKFKGLSTFWKTVILIEIADLAFSLDNVMAVIAISQNILIVIIGVFISIFIMRFFAQGFIKLIEFEPLLEHGAYVLILVIAIELLLTLISIHIDSTTQFIISMGILIMCVFFGQWGREVNKYGNITTKGR